MKSPAVDMALSELCAQRRLDGGQRDRLASILDALSADARAPTAVRDPGRAVDVHLADSLVALEVDGVRDARSIADLGTGAGFPGLPLAVALPHADVRLVESQAKKCAFLKRLIVAAQVDNAEVIESRIELWAAGAGGHDAVLARALAPQPVVLEYAAPLLRCGGVLADWRGRRELSDEHAGLRAAAVLGLERVEVRDVRPFAAACDLHLHIYVKASPTPPTFPRRPGMARKHPLERRAASRAARTARSPRSTAPTDRGPR